eukprot:3615579-Rhodomonas_salina.1
MALRLGQKCQNQARQLAVELAKLNAYPGTILKLPYQVPASQVVVNPYPRACTRVFVAAQKLQPLQVLVIGIPSNTNSSMHTFRVVCRSLSSDDR